MSVWRGVVLGLVVTLGLGGAARAETAAEERAAQQGSRTGVEAVRDLLVGSDEGAEKPAARAPATPRAPASSAPQGPPAGPEALQLGTFRQSDREFARGLSAHRRGDVEAAGLGYRAALEIDPTFVEAMVNWARLHVEAGDLASADAWLDQAVAIRPDYPQIYAVRGIANLRRGNFAHAIEDLTIARDMLPDEVEVLSNLGAAYLRKGDVAKARKALERALRIDPDHLDAVYNMALAHDLSGSPGRAEYHYSRFLRLSAGSDASRAGVIHRLEQLGGIAPAAAVSAPPPGQVRSTR